MRFSAKLLDNVRLIFLIYSGSCLRVFSGFPLCFIFIYDHTFSIRFAFGDAVSQSCVIVILFLHSENLTLMVHIIVFVCDSVPPTCDIPFTLK